MGGGEEATPTLPSPREECVSRAFTQERAEEGLGPK